nr:PASTA domain-containing protein [Bacteroidales bacterium]
VGRAGDPGSVFKTITLTACMDDGYVNSVEETVPTNHGRYGIKGKLFDQHVYEHEKKDKTDEIKIIDGLKVSSNLVFHDLAVKYYKHQPEKFIEKLNSYHLLDRFAFDLDGLSKPTYNKPGTASWSGASIGTMAYGYSITLTPLHVLMFYNAIANHGKMMKPYLVEDIESHGTVKKNMGQSVLNSSVCSRSVADSVSRALRAVVKEGTGRLSLGKAKLPVAGKTGTARVVLPNGKFFDEQGRFINQGTFVGFFPYDTAGDNAKYSIIVTMYSELGHKSLYGASGPAGAIREIVDEIYGLQSEWSKEHGDTTIVKHSGMPDMGKRPEMPQVDTTRFATIPDVRGLGLRDAIAIIENSGFRCSYSGVGHVKTVSPAPEHKCAKGATVTLTLR